MALSYRFLLRAQKATGLRRLSRVSFFGEGCRNPLLLLPGAAALCVLVRLATEGSGSAPTSPREHRGARTAQTAARRRLEPPEHTSCSLLRSRRCSDPNPAPVGDADWLWFQVIGQKRDSRQVRRKRLGSNSASSPPQIPVPRGKPCRQESHIWRRCRRLKWSLGHWNCRHTVSAARRPGCCAAHRWTEAITRFLVLWAVRARNAGLGGKAISPLRRRQFGGATNR